MARAHERDAVNTLLIDIDGTLIDSNEAHARAWADILHEHGWPEITWQQVLPLIGMGGDKLLPSVAGIEIDSELGEQLAKRRWEIFQRDYLPRLKPTPGARDGPGRARPVLG